MVFNATYDSSDVSEAAISGLAVMFIVIAELTVVIVLIGLFVWGRKKMK